MIVSIYIQEHSYLTDEPQTLNFGGKYIYEFREINKNHLKIHRRHNLKFVANFFDVSKSKCKISLLSAIVGENGAGKSSILNVIRSSFIKHPYSMPSSVATILVEVDGETHILRSDYEHIELFDNGKLIKIKRIKKGKYQSIYYSPHFDLKYNFNFDEVDNYDISLDQYIKDDLLDIDKKGSNENGWRFGGHEELAFKNTLRQIEFITSDLFKKNEILSAFNLPEYENVRVYFRDIEVDEKFWNTPGQFRDAVRQIKTKANEEMDKWHTIRKFDENHKVSNQKEINQYLLKRFIINAILSVISRMMEEKNTFFDSGLLDGIINKSWNAEKSFLEFIKIANIKISGHQRQIFNSKVYFSFFEEIDKVLKGDLTEEHIRNKSIDLPVGKIVTILNLHREMVKGFFNYYADYGENSVAALNLYEFIGLRPLDQSMSSGELAMFNFFSRLSYFIENNFKGQNQRLKIKKKFILLLDEADLAFHPVWKKKYVNTVLKTIPYFFDSLKNKPDLQVIITTHDPLTLSDLPIDNVVFLKKDNGKVKVVSSEDQNKIQKTFGANITELLANSFFIKGGLIGDFAKSKIEEVIGFINESKKYPDNVRQSEEFQKKLAHYKKVISIIDEKIVKMKLTEMITELSPDDEFHNKIIENEIDLLQKKLKR
ncbi:AAA family ATPase [Chryseobacterium sp. CFBP8996]|uniref:AAA family ATPase n=1 Tax=Chryseobacterium sp. CFBP8996 TaxID=3096529 RepID=UPI002A6A23D5|nr:AAA family ATPase [Chryseobacterium sp. CFBP8996]MDY0930736.1 AAA family ATPase [Chryseobacterium sp. CFBP8996]